ncbi:MAG: flagellar motor protein MotB [Candidatus Marinimicrobia bacterium]|nr:flagellar motor protein MotB [Candidatus Neomarinimicrobiota bacterium]MCF7904070.1 flagellar motor protein MotB [Candidatus Neomarinimicrobiota bacterium]
MKYILPIIVLATGLNLISCAANEELLLAKQAEVDSLITLNSSLRNQLQDIESLEAELERLRGQDAELKEALAKLAEIKDVEVEDNRTLITNDLLFQSGSFKISSKGKEILDNIWSVLRDHPDRQIFIVGHTDDMPIHVEFREAYRSNWDLSTWRALAVLHYLRKLPNANPDRLTVGGFGPNQPIADNDTETGRARNRRVEIILGDKMD